MARPDTWMPMYWRDFWADTGHLSPIEGWAYLNLIGAYWTNGGPLANDDARLQRQAKVSAKEWKASRSAVMAFFAVDDTAIHHKRIDAELATATARHAAKVKAGANGAKKRWQTDSTAIAEPSPRHKQTDAQLQPHSPDGETEAKASGGRKRPAPKAGTRISPDWKPSAQDTEHAEDRRYTRENIEQLASHFRDYHLAKGTVSRDWSASWRTWVANDQKFSAQRGNGAARQQPRHNRPEPGSIVDLANRLKARAGLGGQHHGSGGMGWNRDGLQAASDDRDQTPGGDSDGGIILEADECERMHRPARGNEAADEGAAGAGEGPGSAAFAVRQEVG